MLGLFARGERHVATPAVPVPRHVMRSGKADGALVRAFHDSVEALRFEGGYALSELDPNAVRAYAAARYLRCVARAGHAGYLADPGPEPLRQYAQEGLEAATPELFAELHATALGWANDAEGAEGTEAVAAFDAVFRDAGGLATVHPGLSAWIARLDTLQVVPQDAYAERLSQICSENPQAKARRRDLSIARFERRLTDPLESGVAIILARTTRRVFDFVLEPGGTMHFGDGRHAVEWSVATRDRDFVAVDRGDRVIVYRAEIEGGGRTALGNLDHEKIGIAADWARRGHVAIAAVKGLDRLDMAGRLMSIVFEKRRTLRSGSDAAGFHMALDGRRDLALVVFREVSAVVEPETNDRLAEFDHRTLARAYAAHAERLAELTA